MEAAVVLQLQLLFISFVAITLPHKECVNHSQNTIYPHIVYITSTVIQSLLAYSRSNPYISLPTKTMQ